MLRLQRGPSLRALVYHDVPSQQLGNLRLQLEAVGRTHDFIDGPAFADLVRAGGSVGRRVVVTFDDGYVSQVAVAREVLDPLGIKGAFFVSTGFLEARTPVEQKTFLRENLLRTDVPDGDAPPHVGSMTWDDARELAANGHTIGSHTVSHLRLSKANADQVSNEITRSAEAIAGEVGSRVDLFAYPFGTVDSVDHRAIVAISGRYTACFSSVRGDNARTYSPYAILRETVDPGLSPQAVRLMLAGGFDFPYRRQVRRLQRVAGTG